MGVGDPLDALGYGAPFKKKKNLNFFKKIYCIPSYPNIIDVCSKKRYFIGVGDPLDALGCWGMVSPFKKKIIILFLLIYCIPSYPNIIDICSKKWYFMGVGDPLDALGYGAPLQKKKYIFFFLNLLHP